ncbi:Batten's disease protein Cln3, partial [Kipferlia bialata]
DAFVVYNALYQCGVFISRSSISLHSIPTSHLMVPSLLQALNLGLLILNALVHWLPGYWAAFVVFFWEGLLGGSVYVNAFNNLNAESHELSREFSMGICSMADSVGIALASVLSIVVENWLLPLQPVETGLC